ncbi:hypothetical protein [Tsukamurella pseudospumae]|uniref:Uncharacterized protein n=1 Tax=Tsukamurella pseudospumae TaxID=239498 RepID=A0A138AED6_9ACTN|nr:hypothetical protein [Tsukamurella pseudospumae]KXP08739.1 hypothetical protein AXK60_08675 [Tsukamurella pseudospumae]
MSQLPTWATILTSGATGALVTVLVNRFVVGPRPDLRLSPSTALVDDLERITRKNEGDFTGVTWMPLGWLSLTNYGDGTAHDVRLAGMRCRPRVSIGDSGTKPYAGQAVETDQPLWSNIVAAIAPGESVNVCVVARHDPSQAKPTVTASWPRLAGRRWGGRHRVTYDFATPRQVEYGLPGQTSLGEA